jgi:hypothetical protein
VRCLFFVLLLAVGLVLAGCDASDSQAENAGKERGSQKATKDERSNHNAGVEKKPKAYEGGSQPRSSGASAQYSTDPEPEEVLASQYEHINAGAYGAAYKLFDDQSQRAISLGKYKAYFASVAPYEITGCSFPSVQTQGDEASVVVDLDVSSSEGEDAYRVTQRLVREDGAWRLVMRDEQTASFAEVGSSPESASASASTSPSPGAASGVTSGDHDATVTVSRVVDGDTIEVSPAVDGIDEVRLIGVDTPRPRTPPRA